MMEMYPIILVAVDGSSHAEKALEASIQMANAFGSKLVIATVYLNPPVMGNLVDPASHMSSDAIKKLSGMLEGYKKQALESGVKEVETDLLSTFASLMSVGAVLIMEAEKIGCDLIVIGTRGLTGLKRVVLGSTADYVVKNAKCDVHIVRS
jgi:nucleotide-binding universal stress UspA family protein